VINSGEYRFARGALDTPDGEPTQPDPDVMRVASPAPASMTGHLVFQLKAQSEEKGEDTFQERLPITQQLKIGRFVLKIDGDGPVFTGLAGGVAHGSPSSQMVGVADDPTWGNACPMARG